MKRDIFNTVKKKTASLRTDNEETRKYD